LGADEKADQIGIVKKKKTKRSHQQKNKMLLLIYLNSGRRQV
jgi:hypothetical protein